jgi:integrase
MIDAKRRGHKRGHGEGSIDQMADGRWRARLMVGYKPDGKPDRRAVYGRTRAECQRRLDDLRRRSEQGMAGRAGGGRETVGAFLLTWLGAIDGTIRRSTYLRYETNVRMHLVPALGRHKLADLGPEHLVALYAAKRKEGLAPRTVKYLHATMRRALALGVKWGSVSRNVAAAVDPPKVPRVEITPPSAEQVARLLDTAEANGDRLAPLWTVAAFTGCREGELLGLRWEDLDPAAGTLSIRRSLSDARGGAPTFDEPKTPRSRRTIRLSPDALAALRVQRDRQGWDRQKLGDDYTDYGLVFASGLGTPLLKRNVIRAFKAALARAELPRSIRIHDLRHAHATIMRKAGADMKTVSERLGHSSIAITADLYTHAVAGPDADAAERMQAAISTARRGSLGS